MPATKTYIISDEERQQISLRNGNPSDKTRAKMSLSHTGKTLTDEHKRNMSIAHKGLKHKPMSTEGRMNIANGQMGKKRKPHSLETRAKMSAAAKKRYNG